MIDVGGELAVMVLDCFEFMGSLEQFPSPGRQVAIEFGDRFIEFGAAKFSVFDEHFGLRFEKIVQFPFLGDLFVQSSDAVG